MSENEQTTPSTTTEPIPQIHVGADEITFRDSRGTVVGKVDIHDFQNTSSPVTSLLLFGIFRQLLEMNFYIKTLLAQNDAATKQVRAQTDPKAVVSQVLQSLRGLDVKTLLPKD